MKCGVCGKEMGDGDRSLIAVSISFETTIGGWEELAKRQFGSFDPSRKYVLCYECWLLSLGFRPTQYAPVRPAIELLRVIRNAGDVEISDFSNEFWQEVDAVLNSPIGRTSRQKGEKWK